MATPVIPLAHQRDTKAEARHFGLGALGLIAANIGVAIYFFVQELSLYQLVLVFWCECLWIGLASAAKLIVASIIGSPFNDRLSDVSAGAAVLLSLFVIGFAGAGFLSLTGLILMLILSLGEALPGGGSEAADVIVILQASLLLAGGHAVSFVAHFLLGGEFRRARVGQLVALPYLRCLALLGAIAISVFVIYHVPFLGDITSFAALLVLFKLAWDLQLHINERRALARSNNVD